MKSSCLLCFSLAAACCLSAAAQQPETVLQKQVSVAAPQSAFRTQVWQNPALNFYRQDFSLSSLALNGRWLNKGEAYLSEEGSSQRNSGLNATSFVKLSDAVKVFGSASYSSERQENVLWNETSDFSVVYPYVTGDSIGGKMTGETYAFQGGYSRTMKEWTLGVVLNYRAAMHYRRKDPRPKNVVSDLNVSAGVSHKLWQTYQLGAALHVRKYDQKSDIDFMSELGSTSVYHMLGLGMNYVRFAGNVTDAVYKGTGVGASIDLLPQTANGLSASLRADHFHFSKQLSNISYLPITEVDENKLALELAWMKQEGGLLYGTRLVGHGKVRTGTENIFGDPTGSSYPLISSLEQYEHTSAGVVLSGLLATDPLTRRFSWSVEPQVAYQWNKEEYKNPQRFTEYASWWAGLKAGVQWQFRQSLLAFTAGGGYSGNLTARKQWGTLDLSGSVGQSLLHNFAYLTDQYGLWQVGSRYDYKLKGNQLLFATLSCIGKSYKECGAQHEVALSVGMSF